MVYQNLKMKKNFYFLRFHFFRISKFISAKGTKKEPVIIEMEVIPKKEILEKRLKKGDTIIYDKKENCMKFLGDKEEEKSNENNNQNSNNCSSQGYVPQEGVQPGYGSQPGYAPPGNGQIPPQSGYGHPEYGQQPPQTIPPSYGQQPPQTIQPSYGQQPPQPAQQGYG